MAYKGYIGNARVRHFENLPEKGSTINSIFNCFISRRSGNLDIAAKLFFTFRHFLRLRAMQIATGG